MNNIETPELEKQSRIINSGKAGLIQDFYDWIREQGWEIAEPVPDSLRGYYRPIFRQPEDVLADFFGIDRDKIEAERRILIADARRRYDIATETAYIDSKDHE